jgi:hypothetical protein
LWVTTGKKPQQKQHPKPVPNRVDLQIAGPALSPQSFHFATLDPPAIRPGVVIFKPGVPPLNVIGGYRFPGAPAIELATPASGDASHKNGDDR